MSMVILTRTKIVFVTKGTRDSSVRRVKISNKQVGAIKYLSLNTSKDICLNNIIPRSQKWRTWSFIGNLHFGAVGTHSSLQQHFWHCKFVGMFLFQGHFKFWKFKFGIWINCEAWCCVLVVAATTLAIFSVIFVIILVAVFSPIPFKDKIKWVYR